MYVNVLYIYLSLCGWTEVAEILNKNKISNNRGWESVVDISLLTEQKRKREKKIINVWEKVK